MPYTLPPLPYDYAALEPSIDEETMRIHHDKHHAAYVNNLNTALEGHDDLLAMPVEKLIANLDKVPEAKRTAVRNNGGGHANHSLFWTLMTPGGASRPDSTLAISMENKFGSFDSFKEQFAKACATRFGSGWGWLSMDADGALRIESTANQDSPLMEGRTPLLGCDVWEHAYYLKYQNKRPDYVTAWWKVVNWTRVGEIFAASR
ncbi:MAG: superoxide dismutase [Gemmatimonadales bacterium]|nr:superoxide dismutase [Gemmatimonadales bacterium]